jgi:hypothetical protein
VSIEEEDPADSLQREIKGAIERLRHQRGELYEVEHPAAEEATEPINPAEPSDPISGSDPLPEPAT